MLEFNPETFLIDRLMKSAALIFVDFKARPNNRVTLLLIDKF